MSTFNGLSIYSAANCSVVSGLLPPGVKKFLGDFVAGNLLRNPLTQVFDILGPQITDVIGQIGDLEDFTEDLQQLNQNLFEANAALQRFQNHTNTLSGIISTDPEYTLDQILGVMSAYNTMKDILKDKDQLLQDNFSQAFSSLDPRLVGPFFDNFGTNMNEIERLLGEVAYQIGLSEGEETEALASAIRQLGELAGNIGDISNTLDQFINQDKAFYTAAAIALADYALANGLVSSVLSDPCFGAQLITNVITQPGASSQLSSIAAENGITTKGSPIDFLSLMPSLQSKAT